VPFKEIDDGPFLVAPSDEIGGDLCVTVDLDGEPRTAWTYIGLREAIERCEREHPGTA